MWSTHDSQHSLGDQISKDYTSHKYVEILTNLIYFKANSSNKNI